MGPSTKDDTYPKRTGRHSTVLDDFLRLANTKPDQTALVSYLASKPDPIVLSYAKMAHLVDQLAIKLLALGVNPRDFVSYQLPNRWEFAIAHLATIRIGAISNPIMPIYGKREVRFMLERTRSPVCITVKRTPRADLGKMHTEIKEEIDVLKHLVLIDDGTDSLENQLEDIRVDDQVRRRLDGLKPSPDDIEAVMFSSGTTGEPKAVLHSFNSIYLAVANSLKKLEIGDKDVVLMSSPLGHATGFLYGFEMPLMCGCKFVLQDTWNPDDMLRVIERERVTWTMGSAAFIKDACDAAERNKFDTSSLRSFVSGGAPIPPQLVGRMTQLLGGQLIPCWGMTELGIGTLCSLQDSMEKRASCDGTPVKGVELRIVDDHGDVLPPNTPGNIQIRATAQHVGYFMNDALYKSSFQDGWFETGDLGRINEHGELRIVGRSKDIVIRGGENIPIIEIENMLLDHPEVADIVIIGVPDERLGERCHAVVVPKVPGYKLTLSDLTSHLKTLDVTKQYWPESLSMADSLPRTASGKVQRFVIREAIIKWGKLMQFKDIIYDESAGIATITINRPQVLNAFAGRTVDELIQAFMRAWVDRSVRAVILTGAGDRAFCTGGDQSNRDADGYQNEVRSDIGMDIEALHSVIRDIPKPVIAAVNGYAIGGGHVLQVICDLTISSDKAKFGQAGPRVGSVDAGFGTCYLAAVVGEKKAREIWYLCRQYTAEQALEMGLINAVVPHERLMEEARSWAMEIVQLSPTAIKLAKQSFNVASEKFRGLEAFASSTLALFYGTEEAMEGRNAFMEKRKPDFNKFAK
jgi:cyclohexanecarboxylate-CoA ligase/2-ketocyclohexanecarboxyl-CoA hydrolase